jgi:hypothetical protein
VMDIATFNPIVNREQPSRLQRPWLKGITGRWARLRTGRRDWMALQRVEACLP